MAKTRETAGGYMHDAWKCEPVTDVKDMNVPGGLDFSALDEFEKAYLDAVAEDLAWYRFWR